MKSLLFQDRKEAGQRLAQALKAKNILPGIVLGLPRGGVPVAVEVAKTLGLPLNVLIVKKIGAPNQPEYAMGALAEQGEPLWNEQALRLKGETPTDLKESLKRTRERIDHLIKRWRGQTAISEMVKGRDVLLVDDGLATGLTMLAAVRCLKRLHARRVVVAVPVGSQEGVRIISREADETIALNIPDDFSSVSQWFEDFAQVSDDEVEKLLQ